MQWVPASKVPAPAASATPLPPATVSPPVDPTFAERKRILAGQVLGIGNKFLGTTDPQVREDARRALLEIRDPAAAEPIARILGAGDEEARRLACEALGAIPGDEAVKHLVKFILGEQSDPVYMAAVAALKERPDDHGVRQLLNALNGSTPVMQRAAFALGEIGDLAAGPALVGRLHAPELRVLEAPMAGGGGGSSWDGPGGYMFVGKVVSYISNATPVIADRAVGWDLQIGAIPVGTVLNVDHPRVTINRTIIEIVVRQPVVQGALQKMTGQDFGFDSEAWRKWFARQRYSAVSIQTTP